MSHCWKIKCPFCTYKNGCLLSLQKYCQFFESTQYTFSKLSSKIIGFEDGLKEWNKMQRGKPKKRWGNE